MGFPHHVSSTQGTSKVDPWHSSTRSISPFRWRIWGSGDLRRDPNTHLLLATIHQVEPPTNSNGTICHDVVCKTPCGHVLKLGTLIHPLLFILRIVYYLMAYINCCKWPILRQLPCSSHLLGRTATCPWPLALFALTMPSAHGYLRVQQCGCQTKKHGTIEAKTKW